MNKQEEDFVWHYGGCHCKKVEFKVWTSKHLYVYNCNCTICFMKQNIHFVVPSRNFKLLHGEEHLTAYTFNTHQAKHLFCKFCGVQSFYVPRSNPDGFGVNPNCLVKDTIASIKVQDFNGLEWESSIEEETTKPDSIQSRSK